MDGPRQVSLAARLPRLLRETMARAPWAALRLIDIAFSPRQHIRMLVLVSAIQLVAAVSRRLRRWYRLTLPHNAGLRIQERARTQEEWIAADNIQAAAEDSRRVSANLSAGDDAQAFLEELTHRARTYARLQDKGDEYGLMFHLRSELMRRQVGGAGYERDGSKRLLSDRRTRQLITGN